MGPDDLQKWIDTIAKNLSEPAKTAFTLMVQYTWAHAVLNAVLGTILLVAALIFGAVIAPRVYRWYEAGEIKAQDAWHHSSNNREVAAGFALALGGFAAVFATLFGIIILSSSIVPLLAPEASTLHDLVVDLSRAVR